MSVSFRLHVIGLLAATAVCVAAGPEGPYEIPLFATAKAPAASGHARLVYAHSPFGIAVSADGRARYDVQVDAAALPRPDSLGSYRAYVAWATSTDLSQWVRLGPIREGRSTVGPVEMNKFLLVITAERDALVTQHTGPTILHGTSPSGWLQSFLSHPLFRGIPQ